MAITVDAHHHFWDTSDARFDYYWMTDDLAPIRGRYGPAELRPWLAENGVDRTVVVQTIPSLLETEEFLATAATTDFVAGVVGWVDLVDPAAGDMISALQARIHGDKLVSIRHQAHDEPDPDWLGRRDVRLGVQAVLDAGLAYDILVRSRELPSALRLVASIPDGRFVVDHIAKPNIAKREIEPWATRMRPLADFPNVFVKVSGMITEADWQDWRPDDLRPYVQRLLEWFGPERLMFGSDWPVCQLAGTYSMVHAAALHALGELSDSERELVMGGTAAAAYRLQLQG
ncbi:MAG TPA: amidohydrolase family protein [Vicinamibacterales bacterium]